MSAILATKSGFELLLCLLVASGAMCPQCGIGTRVTSKRWAKCKGCGRKVERRSLDTLRPVLPRSRKDK